MLSSLSSTTSNALRNGVAGIASLPLEQRANGGDSNEVVILGLCAMFTVSSWRSSPSATEWRKSSACTFRVEPASIGGRVVYICTVNGASARRVSRLIGAHVTDGPLHVV